MSERSAYEVGVALLTRREHSTKELKRKLEQRGLDNIEETLEQLKALNYLDDVRFAEAYIRQRMQKGYGPVRIRIELQDRGIDEIITEEYLDYDWFELAEQVRAKKFGDSKSEPLKQKRFLQYRGFDFNTINELF